MNQRELELLGRLETKLVTAKAALEHSEKQLRAIDQTLSRAKGHLCNARSNSNLCRRDACTRMKQSVILALVELEKL